MDELAIGFTLGLSTVPVVAAVLVVAVATQAFVMAQVGIRLGGQISERFQEGAERIASVILTGHGAVVFLQEALS